MAVNLLIVIKFEVKLKNKCFKQQLYMYVRIYENYFLNKLLSKKK